MYHHELLANQSAIYARLRIQQELVTKVTGTEPDPALMHRRGGFFLSLIHEQGISMRASTLSRHMGAYVPMVSYDNKELHTTLGSLVELQGDHFYFDTQSPVHAKLRETTVEIAREVVAKTVKDSCVITFSEPYIVTPHIVIAPGEPNEGFVELVNMAEDVCCRLGVTFKAPWGAHITLGRFTAARGPKEIDGLLNLLKGKEPLGMSRIIGIAAGYTLRHPNERTLANLGETRGPFNMEQFFAFR